MDTERIWIHTLQHLNPHSMGSNLTPWNLIISEVKLTPPFILQIGTTRVMTNPTPDQVAQMDLEDPVAPTNQEVQMVLADPADLVVQEILEISMAHEVWADPATTIPISKISCENS